LLSLLGWLFAGLLLLLLSLLALSGWLSPGLGAQLFYWGRISLYLLSGFYLLWSWLRVESLERAAEHLEAALPLHDGLLSFLQFQREWSAKKGSGQLEALAEQLVERLENQKDLPWVVSFRPLRRPWAFAGGALFLCASFIALSGLAPLERLWSGSPPEGGQELQQLGPLVGDLKIKLHYPDYLQRPPQQRLNVSGAFKAPKGTRLELSATTLEPAKALLMRFKEGEDLPWSLKEGREGQGVLLLERALEWRFVLRSREGTEWEEQIPRHIHLESDHPPLVKLKEPAEDLELDDPRTLSVSFEAKDDFGLSRAAILIALVEQPEQAERQELLEVSGRRFLGQDDLDLSLLHVQPGDRLALTVEVYDNNGVDGPQRGISATRFITIRSPKSKHYALSASLRESLELMITALADRLEFEPLVEHWGDLKSSSQAAISAFEEVLKLMAEDPLTAKEIYLALQGRLIGLERAFAAVHAPEIQAEERLNQGVIEELEQSVILLEAMIARMALEDMAALAEEIRAAKAHLRELMQGYKERPSEALKKRIMRDLQRLRQRIDEMRARMAQLSQRLPQEFLNLEGMKKGEVSKSLEQTKDQIEEMKKLLEEEKIDEALSALEEMEQALDELSGALEKDMQKIHEESNPALQKAISELMDQTRDLIKRQESLSQKTENLRQEQAAQMQKMLKEELGNALKEIKENAGQLRLRVEKIEPQQLPRFMEDDLEHLRERVDHLNQALADEQVMEALEAAERSMDQLESLSRFSYNRRSSSEKRSMREAHSLNQGIIQELARLISQARRKAGQQQASQGAQHLSGEQTEIGRSTQRLQQRLQQQTQQLPGLEGVPQEQLKRARSSMEEAAQQLRHRKPSRARPGQQQAMHELQGLMEGLKRSAKPKQAQGQRQGGRRSSQEQVQIPKAKEYEAPAEFRQELLEAMKDRAPEEFQESVKRYYESLVR